MLASLGTVAGCLALVGPIVLFRRGPGSEGGVGNLVWMTGGLLIWVHDLAALPRTLAIAQATKRKVALVVMALPLQWAESREITSALDEFKVPFYGITSQRASYARAIISGSTAAELGDRVAAREVDLLVKTILR